MRNRYSVINTVILIFVFIALEVTSIVLITNSSIVQKYRIIGSVRSFQSFFWQTNNNIGRYFSLKSENDALIEENHLLKQQVINYQNLYAETENIDSFIDGGFTVYPAIVIKNSLNKQNNYLFLNKGSIDGIKEGMGVISNNGVIGIVNSVSKNYSQVISFLNTSQSISVKIARSDYYGPMKWDGISRNTAIMSDVPLFCDAAPGDTIVTSGLSSIYPPNIPIGLISEIKSIGGLYKTLDITLFQDFNSLNIAYIIENKDIEEIKNLEKPGGEDFYE